MVVSVLVEIFTLHDFTMRRVYMCNLIHLKKALDWLQHFSHYKSMVIFSEALGQQANSAVRSLILSNFEPIRIFMVVLVTCKNEEDPIKNKGTRVVATLFIDLSDALRTASFVVDNGILSKSKLIQA